MKQLALPRFFTLAAVGEALGVSEKTLRRRIKDGALKAHKIGHQWRVSEDDFRAYVALLRT